MVRVIFSDNYADEFDVNKEDTYDTMEEYLQHCREEFEDRKSDRDITDTYVPTDEELAKYDIFRNKEGKYDQYEVEFFDPRVPYDVCAGTNEYIEYNSFFEYLMHCDLYFERPYLVEFNGEYKGISLFGLNAYDDPDEYEDKLMEKFIQAKKEQGIEGEYDVPEEIKRYKWIRKVYDPRVKYSLKINDEVTLEYESFYDFAKCFKIVSYSNKIYKGKHGFYPL